MQQTRNAYATPPAASLARVLPSDISIDYWHQIKLRGDYLPAKDSMTPQILHPQAAAERIARECAAGDPDWTYKVMQFGKYFAVEVSDEDGLIGYL